MNYEKKLFLYNTNVLIYGADISTLKESTFELVTGSRLMFELNITAIDGGASVSIDIENGMSIDYPLSVITNMSSNAVGCTKKVLSDVHNLFKIKITVTGGNASYAFGVSIADNALTTRIENAEINVDLDHVADGNGDYDSVRLGNGSVELTINPDGSLNFTDNGGSITVDADNLDIRDLDALQDNVGISDGVNDLGIQPDGSIDVNLLNSNVFLGADFVEELKFLQFGAIKSLKYNGQGSSRDYDYAPVTPGETVYVAHLGIVLQDPGNQTPDSFGALNGPLNNGLLITIKSKGIIYTLANLTTNLDLSSFFKSTIISPSTGFYDSRDAYIGQYDFPFKGITLNADDGDYIRATVQDNLNGIQHIQMGLVIRREN